MAKVFVSIPARDYRFAEQVCHFLNGILPPDICHIATATTRFQFEGLDSIGNEYGIGVRTRMQTFGRVPHGLRFIKISRDGNFITAHSKDAANIILHPFGLSVEHVLSCYGTPPDGEKYEMSLIDIIKGMSTKSNIPEIRHFEFAA